MNKCFAKRGSLPRDTSVYLFVLLATILSGCSTTGTSSAGLSAAADKAARDAAAAVVSACKGTPNAAPALAAAMACNQAAADFSSAVAAFESAAKEATDSASRRVAAEESVARVRDDIAHLEQNLDRLHVADTTPVWNAEAGGYLPLYDETYDRVNFGGPVDPISRLRTHISEGPPRIQTVQNFITLSPFATNAEKAEIDRIAYWHDYRVREAQEHLASLDAGTWNWPYHLRSAVQAEWEMDRLEQEAQLVYRKMYLREAEEDLRVAAQEESDAIAAQEKARADRLAAVNTVMAAMAKADSIAQRCGATPMAMPGVYQTFSDFHKSGGGPR